MGAEFYDTSLVEDGDQVGVADGGNAVGDEDGGASAHDFAEVVEDFVFGVGVDAGEGVVEDEDAWAAEQGAGDGGALLLASGEGDAAFADRRVVAFGEAFDVLGDVGGFGGGFDVVKLRLAVFLRYAEGDVFADGVAEEECLLRDEADVPAQRVEREFADGVAVDEDGAGLGVVDPRDQIDERRFAGAGGADDGQAGAGGNAQVDVFEDGGAVIGEVEIAEFDFALELVESRASSPGRDGRNALRSIGKS